MTKQQKKSRLKETDFSHYNLREAYINSQAEYVAALRDEAIFSNWGIAVSVKVPTNDWDDSLNENNVDEYSNFVDVDWLETTEVVVPKFTEYRQNVSEEGMSADGTDALYPLEVLIPSKLHLPRNSRLIFNEYNSREEKIAREWVVLGTVQKQLSGSKTYTRVANCVPARKELFNTSETALGIIWFDYNVANIFKYGDLRAQGDIWFIRNGIDGTKVRKMLSDEINEQIPEYPQYNEKLSLLVYYDTRAKNIIEPGSGFNVDDRFNVLDVNGRQVWVNIDEANKVALEIIVTEVDTEGKLLAYTLNTENGYTRLSDNEEGLIVTIGNPRQEKATVVLHDYEWLGDDTQETLTKSEILNPKYLTPYQLDAVFVAKKPAISVLN